MLAPPGSLAASAARAGHLTCACPEDATARPRRMPGEATLIAGFALMVLAQALTFGVLPLAGAMIAPRASLAAWPVAALLLGAAAASLPAAFLLDAFGRRAGFALGASLGVAGGLVAAFAVIERVFPLLLVGAAWLGAAQGFGLFYRHAAAIGAGPGGASGAVGRLLGAGALAGVAGPLLAGAAEAAFAPYLFVGTLALAAIAQLGVLMLAVAVPEARTLQPEANEASPALPLRALLAPTLAGALAWAAMSSAMATTPLALADCGIAVGGIAGVVGWHVVAMYAPALVAGRLADRIGARRLALAALTVALVAAAVVQMGSGVAGTVAGFLAVGAGWPLATVGATAWLHEAGTPSRLQMAGHDVALIAGAVLGVVLR